MRQVFQKRTKNGLNLPKLEIIETTQNVFQFLVFALRLQNAKNARFWRFEGQANVPEYTDHALGCILYGSVGLVCLKEWLTTSSILGYQHTGRHVQCRALGIHW